MLQHTEGLQQVCRKCDFTKNVWESYNKNRI